MSKLHLHTSTSHHPKKDKSPRHVVVFADATGELLGEVATDHAQRATSLIKTSGFGGELGSVVSDFCGTAGALSVVGVGELGKLGSHISKVATATYKTLKHSKKGMVLWGDVICQKHFGQFALGLLNASYRFETYKSKKSDKDTLQDLLFINTKDGENYAYALEMAIATFGGQSLARDVANAPPNVMNPAALADSARTLAKEHSDVLSVSVLGEKDLAKLGMGCFLAVSQGSDNEGKLVVLEYFGKSGKKSKAKAPKLQSPIALVGKGITFDTGGISLKPAAGMDEMKFDMGGAAAMLGTLKAAVLAKLPLDIVVVLACAENMPSGKATRPGDIVTAMNGTTVEILNTDAEGRLVLCDALCYVQENYKPRTIIDAATLTGACVIALGGVRSGLFTNDEDTLFALENAGQYTGDLLWQLPLDDAYDAQLKSSVADVQNIGGREAGSVTAACFLQRFIKEGQAWAHLDIAGTAWQSGNDKGASGRPVPMLLRYLANEVAQSTKPN